MKPFFLDKNATPLFVIGLTLFFLLCSEPGFAGSTAGGGLPYEDWLTKIMDSITGPFAFAISVIGLVIAGSILIFGGDLNRFALTLIICVLVISLIVAGKNTLTAITGVGALIGSEPIYNSGVV